MDLLALFRSVLGDEHPALAPLADAEPGTDVEIDGATDDEIAAVAAFVNVTDDEIAAIFEALRDVVRDEDNDTDTIVVAKDLALGLTFVQKVRDEAAEAEAELRAEALAALGDDESEDEADDEDAEADEPVAETDEAEEVTEDVQTPEPVAASRPSIRNVANRVRRPAKPAPTLETIEAAAEQTTFRLTDNVGDHHRGDELGIDDVALALADRFQQFAGPATGFEKVRVAQQRWEYPEDRRLEGNFAQDARKIRAAREAILSVPPGDQAALTAAICAPPQPIYEIRTIGTEARPVRDFLTGFQATRGGVTFRPGLPLSSAGTLNANSSGVTTNWVDGDDNKYVLSVACPSTETASVEAFVARAEVSNMQGQFDPESVAAALRLQMVLWARGAETSLLNFIDANSTATGLETTAVVGFGRNLLSRFNQVAVATRSRERMGMNDTLDLLLPSWVIGAFQDDLSLEQPGAAEERLATTQAQIENWFAVRNIRVGWFYDQQVFGAQAAGAVPTNYPQEVEGYIFEPGHHLFLDGGELNLGIVRDSTLNDTNEYQTFMETFEGLASVGVVSYSVTVNVCRSGATSLPIAVGCDGIS